MMNLESLIYKEPYSLKQKEKEKIFLKILNELTNHHYKNSKIYKKIIKNLKYKKKKYHKISEIPFLSVRLFKEFDLVSVKKNKIIKTLHSSGTSNNKLSRIYLDKQNASNQIKVLQKIISNFLGKDRLPMLIIDFEKNKIDRNSFGARIAAINGFSIFGKQHTFILKNNGEIDYNSLNNFLKKFSNKKFLIFGFTSFIFEKLINTLNTNYLSNSLSNGIVIHGGGWKKLEKLKVSNLTFKEMLFNKFNITKIYNYYGLVEQTGSIFFECPCGYHVASNFSDIIIRDRNLKVLNDGEKGFVQVISLIPTSYPGHSILTEDIGELVNSDKCKCGLNGKKFLLHGRVEKAEIRGCSDI